MSSKTLLLAGMFSLALAVAAAGTAVAAESHSHGADSAPTRLMLNNGAKWQTDAPLRKGMDGIRDDMDAALPIIHAGKFQAEEFKALAGKLESHVDYMATNCKLAPEVDEQLHVVLGDVLDGTAAMAGSTHQEEGAITIVQALDAYGKHFDHPGWHSLAH